MTLLPRMVPLTFNFYGLVPQVCYRVGCENESANKNMLILNNSKLMSKAYFKYIGLHMPHSFSGDVMAGNGDGVMSHICV